MSEIQICGRGPIKKLSDDKETDNKYKPKAEEPQPCASSESEDESNESLEKNITCAKPSPIAPRKRKNTANSINSEESKLSQTGKKFYTKKSALYSVNSQASGSGISGLVFVFLIVLLILIAGIVLVSSYFQSETELRKNCTFSKLQKKYETQDKNLWKSLEIGIERILNFENMHPSVYLLLHDDEKSTKELLTDIAQRSSQCFDPNSNPVEFGIANFISEETVNDYGVIIKMYKEKVKDSNVVTIANLNEIPVEAAKALHTICDTYSPIPNVAVIFLTLIPSNKNGKLMEIAEKMLENMWKSKLQENELQPLIARVTDQVFRIKGTG